MFSWPRLPSKSRNVTKYLIDIDRFLAIGYVSILATLHHGQNTTISSPYHACLSSSKSHLPTISIDSDASDRSGPSPVPLSVTAIKKYNCWTAKESQSTIDFDIKRTTAIPTDSVPAPAHRNKRVQRYNAVLKMLISRYKTIKESARQKGHPSATAANHGYRVLWQYFQSQRHFFWWYRLYPNLLPMLRFTAFDRIGWCAFL
jgi:hypothetical protein